MSRQLAKWLLISNAVLWIFNTTMHFTMNFDPQYFPVSIQLTVAFMLGASLQLFRKPNSIKWFKNSDVPSEVNYTISYIFSILFHFPILIFNLGAALQKFGP